MTLVIYCIIFYFIFDFRIDLFSYRLIPNSQLVKNFVAVEASIGDAEMAKASVQRIFFAYRLSFYIFNYFNDVKAYQSKYDIWNFRKFKKKIKSFRFNVNVCFDLLQRH